MASDPIVGFARRLLKATEKGSLEWDSNDGSQGSFIAKAGAGSAEIKGSLEPEGTPTILTVRDGDGKVVETLSTDPARPGAWRSWEESLIELFAQARLAGLGTTKVLGKLAEEWDLPADPGEIPF